MTTETTACPSTTVRRKPDRQTHDPAVLDGILADGFLAHVAMVRDGYPVVLPYLYGVGDLDDGLGRRLLLHGSTGGGLFLDAGTDGLPVSVAISHLDGLVYARSLNDSSANYRSAMIAGRATVVPREQRVEALWQIGDHLMPGRRAEVREMTAKEVAATQVLQVPLDRVSVKTRSGGVGERLDDGEDHGVWAGVLPLAVRAGTPVPGDLAAGTPVAPSVEALVARLGQG
ncbi:pyridoxamine 5'-phosphate oxidase family protein [Isoptericola sp. S6320L]|uniref:pyridoxamine 5'-phosphate oxidase family protein n=1 Tax=Isoptericola sp. S6320L TaxID=2926411 RepID=UPI001FF51409|nr:pyridoxamine 5'-phosphate oxidase family protein [Isoptericola sp. S6320L]MCK0117611.1 pyridoxamine 5'-phosphate oxidase family protein [Isoptericola sp. S6320L]